LNKVRKISGKIVIFAILIIGSLIMILPFYWMVISSFKPNAEILQMPPVWVPVHATFANYIKAFNEFPIFRYYANSLIVVCTITTLTMFTSSLVGFVFGKFEFKGKNIIFLMILSTMMVPFEVRMLPLYKLGITLGLQNSYLGLMFPAFLSTFGIFFLTQHMHSIPNELLDSATIDGCGNLGKYWNIILPLSKQVLGALAIFTFMWNWDDFLWPLLIVNDNSMYTLQLGLAAFTNEQGIEYGVFMACATSASVAVIVVFLIFQKQIVRGIAITGMK
jgi:multiple sugar transport system permease protein